MLTELLSEIIAIHAEIDCIVSPASPFPQVFISPRGFSFCHRFKAELKSSDAPKFSFSEISKEMLSVKNFLKFFG